MHISTNALVTDYVATRFRPAARGVVLAGSLVAYLGIMKVNLGGPGLTRTIKALWGAEAGAGGGAKKEAAVKVAAAPAAPAAAKK
jgi:succinate dehydrogenase (ubiquinone) membrane anchor subunit